MERIKNLFFKNQGTRQVIFKNTFWLAFAEGSASALKLFVLIFAARILGATDYGKFTFAFSFVTIFSLFFDLGLVQTLIREFSKDPEKEKHFSSIISLKLITSAIALGVIAVSSVLSMPEGIIRKVVFILALYVLLGDFMNIFYAFFRARQKMEYEAFYRIFQALLVLGISFFALSREQSFIWLAYAYFISAFFTVIFVAVFFHFKISPLNLSFKKEIWKKFLAISYPFAFLTGVTTILYNNLDSVMLGFFGQITQNGWYNAAYKMIFVALFPMSFVSQSFFPALSAAVNDSKARLQRLWHFQVGAMIFLALPVFFGGFLLSNQIINKFYSPEFIPSVAVFQILLVTAVLIYFYISFQNILIALNHQKKVLITLAVALGLNAILNWFLIPRYSLYGVAAGSVFVHLFILITLIILTARFAGVNPIDRELIKIFLISLIASVIMYFALRFLNRGLFFSVPMGAGIYFIFFFGLKMLAEKGIHI